MISLTEDRRMLGYKSLSLYSNISHFVTTRHGGVSEGAYGSFNCSPYTDDSARKVMENQQLLLSGLRTHFVKELFIPEQVHGNDCMTINCEFLDASLEMRRALLRGVDALITNEPRCCVCVSTADCVPILLYDKRNQAVGAVHAGWRGTVKYIVSAVLQKMNFGFGTKGEDVIACIGPSISFKSFEVGEEVYAKFCETDLDMSRISHYKKETGKYHIDLWEANRLTLLDCGVPAEQIELANICTYIHHEEFFSARRLGINSGRMLSGIMINDEELDYEKRYYV